MIAGLDIRYDTQGGAGHPLLGARLPHVDLMVRRRRATSTALLRSGRPLLLTLHSETAALHRDAEPWSDRIITVAATPATDAATAPGAGTSTGIGAGAVLVRPDGHVVWAQGGDTPCARP